MLKIVRDGKILSESKVRSTSDLFSFADQLNNKLPKSEVWFQELYKPYRLDTKFSESIKFHKNRKTIAYYSDKFNHPFQGFIPDVVNFGFKYIIEVDGSIHNKSEIKAKDNAKQRLYEFNNFKVFRVVANDLASFDQFKVDFELYMQKFHRI